MVVGRETIETDRPTTVQDLFRGESSVTVGGTIATNQKIYVHGIEETNLTVSIDGARQNNKIFHFGGFVDAGFETNGETFSKRGAVYGRMGGFESLLYLNGVDGDNYEDGNGDEVAGSEASLLSGLGKIAYDGAADSLNGKAENDFNFNLGTVTAGFDFYDEEAEFEGEGYRTSKKARNFGGYAQARLDLFERLSLSFGGRVDHQIFTSTDEEDQENTGASGNVSAEYHLTDWLAVKGGYSNVFGGGPGIVEDFTSKGFDIGLGYDWGSGFGQVKFTSVETEIGGDVADTFLGNYFTTPIGDILTVSLVHRFEDVGLMIGGDAEYAFEENSTSINGRALEDYTVVNLLGEYRPPAYQNVRLRAEVKNLLDEDYSDRATYGQDFVDVRPRKQPGRSFGLSTRITF